MLMRGISLNKCIVRKTYSMNRAIFKIVAFVFFLFGGACLCNNYSEISGTTANRSTTVKSEKAGNPVKKGDQAYKEARYALAEIYYKQFVQDATFDKVPFEVWIKLADCQWASREFEACLKTYETLLSQYKSPPLPQMDKVRLSELNARQGNYAEANKWLTGIPGFEKKAAAYVDKRQQLMMREDSDCWKIAPLQIGQGYRFFFTDPC
jgi:hypothetical protein